MRIGIYGGSFNPPHKAHKEVALSVLNDNLVDKLIIVPTGDKYPKEGLIEGQKRFEMLKLLFRDISNIQISDYEIKECLSHTYQTLDYFQKQYPSDEIFFILSTDLIIDIESWDEFEYILSNYRLIGLQRAGLENYMIPEIYEKYPNALNIYDYKIKNLSSTKIRKQIKDNGNYDNLENYLNQSIINYLKENDLYK